MNFLIKHFLLLMMIITLPWRPVHAAVPTMDFTVNMSKTVNVDITGGTPRIAVDVGGNTRYASYASGTGTSALTFTYTATAGDVDLDGVAVSSPVDLNGGTITDLAGNALTNLTFTPPTTTGVKVDYPSLSMDFTNGSRSRKNSIRNSTMQGAVVGVPGTVPTNWGASNSGGLTREVAGFGTENGMSYLDLRYSGTTTGGQVQFTPETSTSAVQGELWTFSFFIKIISGSMGTLSTGVRSCVNEGNPGYLTEGCGVQNTLTGQRVFLSHTRTISNAATTFATPYVKFTPATSQILDFTIRIYTPQFEKGSFATSFIPTTNATVTRQNEFMNISTGAWYNQSAGAFFSNVGWVSSTGSNFPMLARFDDTGNNNRWNLYYNQATNVIGVSGHNAGVTQGGFNSPAQSTTGTIKAAAVQATNSANVAYNGTLGTLDTVWNLPTLTQWTTDATYARIWTKNFKYYPLRITDIQLQLLTQ